MDADVPFRKVGDMMGGSADDVFMTEVLAANMLEINDKLNSCQEAYSSDSVCQVEKVEKPPGLFGDVELLPIDVEISDYDVFPETTPELWLRRYQYQPVLTGESEALHKKAEIAYAKRESVRCAETVVVVETDNGEDFDQMGGEKVSWFNEYDVIMMHQNCDNSCDSLVNTECPLTSQECEVDGTAVLGEGKTATTKRGRGRLPKSSMKRCSEFEKDICKVRTRECLNREAKYSAKSSTEPVKNLCEVLPRRGRGRPRKDNGVRINCAKQKCSNVGAVKTLNGSRKRGRPRKYLEADLPAAELCAKCCVKIGKKFEQEIKEKWLHLRIATADCDV